MEAKILGMHRDAQSTGLLLKVVNVEDRDTELFPPPGECDHNAIQGINDPNGECWSLSLREGSYRIKQAELKVLANYQDTSYLWVRYATPKSASPYPLIATGVGVHGFHNGAGEDELQPTERLSRLGPADPWVAMHEDVDLQLNITYQNLLYALGEFDDPPRQREEVIVEQRHWLKTVITECGPGPKSPQDAVYARCRLPLVGERWEELARVLSPLLEQR